MRLLLTLLSLLPFCYSPIHAAESDKSEFPTKSSDVRYVVGNDLWQPGNDYEPGRDWLALMCDAKGCTFEAATLAVTQESWQGHYDDGPTLGQHLKFTVARRTESEV